MPTPSTHPDWLSALQILRREVGDVRSLWAETAVAFIDYGKTAAAYNKPEQTVYISIPDFDSLPEIERVEILLHGACIAFAVRSEMGMLARARLMKLVGCSHSTSLNIRERWRLIDFETPLHLLPLAQFETRPVCPICSGRVATGAGAWVKVSLNPHAPGPQLATGAELDWWNGLTEPEQQNLRAQGTNVYYKPTVHDECMRYAHTVLAPMLREARAAEARAATAEVDK